MNWFGHRRSLFAGLSAAAATLAAGVTFVPATADPGAAPTADVVRSIPAAATDAEERAVLDYWTPERMAQAAANEAAIVVDDAGQARMVDAPTGAAPMAPPPGANRPPKPSQGVARATPVKEHGKIFLTLDKDTSCSAASVNSPNGAIVLTAGHCMYYPPRGGYAKNVMYVPAYEEKKEPHGRWVAASIKVHAKFSDKDMTHDMGLVTVKKQNGKTINEVVGGHPIEFSGAIPTQAVGHGYPVNRPFDGEKYFTVTSPVWKDWLGGRFNNIAMYSTMTGGSSGGSWIADGKIVSVNSWQMAQANDIMYGPQWGPETKALYDTVASEPAPE